MLVNALRCARRNMASESDGAGVLNKVSGTNDRDLRVNLYNDLQYTRKRDFLEIHKKVLAMKDRSGKATKAIYLH